jgi:hypothetical protein
VTKQLWAIKDKKVTGGQETRIKKAVARYHVGTDDDLLWFNEDDGAERLRLDVMADNEAACTAELRACGFRLVDTFPGVE